MQLKHGGLVLREWIDRRLVSGDVVTHEFDLRDHGVDDRFVVEAIPWDDWNKGERVATERIVVANSEPAAAYPYITPGIPWAQYHDLRCYKDELPTDAEGDEVRATIEWIIDDQPYTGPLVTSLHEGDTIPFHATEAGRRYECRVHLDDGRPRWRGRGWCRLRAGS